MKPNNIIMHHAFTATPEINTRARQQALHALPPLMAMQDGVISYTSRGHLLIIGPEDLIRLVAAQAEGVSSKTLLVMGQVSNQEDEHLERAMQAAPELTPLYLPFVSLSGWLGAFQLRLSAPDGQEINPAEVTAGQPHYDLVLDLNADPVITSELSPPGYFAIGPDANRLADALEEIAGMVGEFEKPQYVQVNHDICAHADRGNMGCTRCLDVCPADAISSHNNTPSHDFQISVDTHLCHGAGSCTTVCPTGALSFAAPKPATQLDRLRNCLDSYFQAGGEKPALMIHAEHYALELDQLPAHVIPVALEEVGALGADTWLSLLAYGATYIAILVDDETPATLKQLLQDEISLTGHLLQAIGHPQSRISVLAADTMPDSISTLNASLEAWEGLPKGMIFPYEGKRQTINVALDRLMEQADANETPVSLPNGSPYGQVIVDDSACTLCMSCVSVCPTAALKSASDKAPVLAFLEGDCVQCGLCEATCPERAISLEARFAPAAGTRGEVRILKQEEPFNCIRCSKPFATKSTIEKISQKLEAHPYFQGEAAKRLQMCDDCRVRDSYRELVADPTAQLRL